MRISHRHRFIFFSNPKTGSESVRKLLDPFSDIAGVPYWERTPEQPFYSHIRPIEVRALFEERGWDYSNYFKFTFVRNPWARLVSLYEMIHASRSSGSKLLGRARSSLLQLTRGHPTTAGFQRWVRTIKTTGSGAGGPANQRWQQYGSYTLRAYAGDENGVLLVDDVVRLEDARSRIPGILEKIGLPAGAQADLPRVNVRRHSPYWTYYDAATTDLVGELYADDIATYNYRFRE